MAAVQCLADGDGTHPEFLCQFRGIGAAAQALGESIARRADLCVQIFHVYSMVGQRNPNPDSKEPALTERETQIMRLLEEGLSNQQIASRLNVTVHTVKNHARSLFSKLGVSSRAEAVAAYRALRYSHVGST